jgi:hypothetical protein
MMEPRFRLPPAIAQGSRVQGNEYGWSVSAFPEALMKAETLGYACLGGQFQFRLEDSTCEMYWLNADSGTRLLAEPWSVYCQRSCSEVLKAFRTLLENTDFRKEASKWPMVEAAIAKGRDPLQVLVFVAYFEDEIDAGNPSAQWLLSRSARLETRSVGKTGFAVKTGCKSSFGVFTEIPTSQDLDTQNRWSAVGDLMTAVAFWFWR